MRNKILLYDDLNAKRHTWRTPGIIPTMKYGGGSIMLWGCFSVAGRLVRSKVQREILDENLLQSTPPQSEVLRFTFQQDNDLKHTVKTPRVALEQVSECPCVPARART